jgi:hypothetical protein
MIHGFNSGWTGCLTLKKHLALSRYKQPKDTLDVLHKTGILDVTYDGNNRSQISLPQPKPKKIPKKQMQSL